jgi:hypothetical protein
LSSQSRLRKFGLGGLAVCVGVIPFVLAISGFRPARMEVDAVRVRVLTAWAVPATAATILGITALYRSIRKKNGMLAVGVSASGLIMGVVGLAGLVAVQEFASDVLFRTHRRAECGDILRRDVWVALNEFRRRHGGFPEKFSQLYREGLLGFNSTRCPEGRVYVSEDEYIASLDDPAHFGNTYVYVGAGLHASSRDTPTPVLYEHLKNHSDGIHVLYSDGFVRWVPTDEMTSAVSRPTF